MYQEIAVGQLRPSPLNPRKTFDEGKLAELAASFAGAGIIEPIVVRANGAPGTYEVVAGERRRRAAILAKLATVPAVVRELSDAQVLEIMVVENNQREGVNPLEEAAGFRALLQTGYELDHLAERLGRSKKYVYDRIKLLDLVPIAQHLLLDGKMSAGHGILLARLKAEDQARALDPEVGGTFARDAGATPEEEETSDEAAVDITPLGRQNRRESVQAFAAYKPRSVRELDRWIVDHVRFNPAQAAQAAPLEFGEVADRAAAAAAKPGRGKKVVSITLEHFVQPVARDEHDRTYGARSWKYADGQEHVDEYSRRRYTAKPCEHAVLGVVVVGRQYGQAFDVCVARDKCQVHWKDEIAERTWNQKLRDSGKHEAASKAEAAERDRREREREAEERKRKAWEQVYPGLKTRALAAARAMTLVKGAAYTALLKHLRLSTSLPPDRLATALLVQATEQRFGSSWYHDEPEMRAWAKALGVEGVQDGRKAPKKPAQTSATAKRMQAVAKKKR